MKYLRPLILALVLSPATLPAQFSPPGADGLVPPPAAAPLEIVSPPQWKVAHREGFSSWLRAPVDQRVIHDVKGGQLDAEGQIHLSDESARVTLRSFETKEDARVLRVRLEGKGPVRPRIEVRSRAKPTTFLFLTFKGSWSPWTAVPASGYFSVPDLSGSREFQVRVELQKDPTAQFRSPAKISFIDLTTDPTAPLPQPPPRPRAPPSADRGQIVARTQWGAYPSRIVGDPTWDQNKIIGIVIHHSASPTVDDVQRHGDQAMVKSIQHYHMVDKGWADVAYHYLITPSGGVFEGVPENIEGSHMKQGNNGWLGICLLGNYDREEDFERAGAGRQAMWELVERLRVKYNVPRYNIVGHQDHQRGRDCPGKHVYNELHHFRNMNHVASRPVGPRHAE